MAESAKLQILYEDNHLIAVVKPAGLLTQGDASGDPCLLESVRTYLKEKYDKPGHAFVGLLHRLDRPVAGVVLFAKTSKGASRLSEQIRAHSVRKVYHALVEGSVRPEEGSLVHYLREGEKRVRVQEVCSPEWKRAELSFRVVERGTTYSLLEIDLKTGRKHQIRAQFAYVGHPLAGDARYGAKQPFSSGIGLLSTLFEFSHPIRNTERVQVRLPVDPREVWRAWL